MRNKVRCFLLKCGDKNEHHYYLLCFKNIQEGLYYYQWDSSSCNLISNLNESNIIINDIHLYPNPAKHILVLEHNSSDSVIIELYNLYGQKVISVETTENKTMIPISHLMNGVYLLKAYTEKGLLDTRKFVKN